MSTKPPICAPTRPGSTTLRLTNLSTLPSHTRTALIHSIAADITATFVYIGKQVEAGRLSEYNTKPLQRVLGTIRDSAIAERRRLQRRVERLERRVTRAKDRERWVRQEFKGLVDRSGVVIGRWRGRAEGWRGRVGVLERENRALRERIRTMQEPEDQGVYG